MFDFKTAEGLTGFSDFLQNNSYATGFTPSGEDVKLLNELKDVPVESYAHIQRWLRHISSFSEEERKSWPSASTSNGVEEVKNVDQDEDIDLFGSDDEDDEEKARIVEARLKAYAEKKAKKPAAVAKSNIIFDVKPWDDTILIEDIEKSIRTIETDGLLWGTAKILPVAFGIKKCQICCVIEDEKVSSDWLEEKITEFEDLVQSVDIVAFNKV